MMILIISARMLRTGAWLIANSYGTNYSKDENGYFWVSYYDPSLCEYYTFECVSADTYQTIFQYDGKVGTIRSVRRKK